MSERPPDGPQNRPQRPDVPRYVLDPLERQSPDRLERIAEYARSLAAWKSAVRDRETGDRRERDGVSDEERRSLERRDISTDPSDYDGVPDRGAYITVKTTKRTRENEYRYYYWQWRDGDSWRNEYIAPVTDESGSR